MNDAMIALLVIGVIGTDLRHVHGKATRFDYVVGTLCMVALILQMVVEVFSR